MKKTTTLKRISLVIACLLLGFISNAQIYVNGPVINSTGTGSGGTDESWCFDVSLAMSNFGYGASTATFYRVADEFVVPAGVIWNIDSLYLYCYQTNAPTANSPITAVYVRVLDDNGGAPGTNVVWGDTTTNRLGTSRWLNAYRVLESATGTATSRGIFKNVCGTSGLSLPAGTYWLDWQFAGSASYSGPWNPPIVITGNSTTGNAMQALGAQGTYAAVTDPGSSTPQGFPFSIFGTVISGIESNDLIKNISLYPNPANELVNLQIDLASTMPVEIEIVNTLGEVVFAENKGQQFQVNEQINCSTFASGIYLIKVKIANEVVTRKFTIE